MPSDVLKLEFQIDGEVRSAWAILQTGEVTSVSNTSIMSILTVPYSQFVSSMDLLLRWSSALPRILPAITYNVTDPPPIPIGVEESLKVGDDIIEWEFQMPVPGNARIRLRFDKATRMLTVFPRQSFTVDWNTYIFFLRRLISLRETIEGRWATTVY